MKIRVVSNRFYFIVGGLSMLLIALLLWLFLPRTVENAVLVSSSNGTSTFLIDGKEVRYRTKDLNYGKYAVVNFKFNKFSVYGFTEVKAIEERVMSKSGDTYDLEKTGPQKVNSKANYYVIDKKNGISSADAKSLIVGKSNVKAYKNKKGLLTTFIMTPIDYSTIRVAISTNGFSSIYHDKIEIKAQSPLKLYSLRENYTAEVPEKTVLSLEISNGKTQLSINNLSKELSERLYIEGSAITVTSLKRGDNNSISPIYSGVMEITPNTKGLLLINEVNIEDYLTKVVPSEMPSSSSIEALKAQAVAARTYALSDMLKNIYPAGGFHVYDSTSSQVYNNITPQRSTNQAVKETKGQVITYNGIPIDAKFYSTSAGTGANYSDIYFYSDGSSDNEPYLKMNNYMQNNISLPTKEEDWLKFYKDKKSAGLDSNYPFFRWQITYPSAALTKALNKSLTKLYSSDESKKFITVKVDGKIKNELPELNNLQDIKVIKRGDAGNIIKIAYIFDNAEVEVTRDELIRGSIKLSEAYAGIPVLIKCKDNSTKNFSSIPSAFFSVEKSNDAFIFYGGGWGHGVGMVQNGAIEMGKKGIDYQSILNYFYSDVIIETLY